MINNLKNYLEERGFNIFFATKASNIDCLSTLLSDEDKERMLILLGSGGKLLWEKLPKKEGEHPIDSYTMNVMKEASEIFLNNDLTLLFPHDQKILPLQQIGRHFNLCHPSPFGPDLSFEFGPWFGFRGVFLTSFPLTDTAPLAPWDSPCTPCPRPCLNEKEFSLARRLCPFHKEHKYTKEQEDYHLKILSKWQNA